MSALHFLKAEGKLVPDGYLTAASKLLSSAMGIAVVHEGFVKVARQKDVNLTGETIGNFVNHANFAKEPMLVNIQDATTFEEDVGPFPVVVTDQGNTLVACAIDGDCVETDSSHTAASVTADAVKRRLKKMFAACNHDVDKLMDDMAGNDAFRQYVMDMIEGDRGTISFMSCTGKFLHFKTAGDASAGDTSFGWVSNFAGWSEKPVEQEKPKNGLKDMMASLLGSSKSDKPADKPEKSKRPELPTIASTEPVSPKPADRTEPNTPAAPSTEPNQPPAEGTPTIHPEAILRLRIPANVMNDPGRKRNYLKGRVPGAVEPNNWKEMTEVVVKAAGAPKKFMSDWYRQEGQNALASIAAANAAAQTKATTAAEVKLPKTPKELAKAASVPATGKNKRPTLPGDGPQPDVTEAKAAGEYPVKSAEPVLKKDTTTDHIVSDDKGIKEGPIAFISPNEKTKIMSVLNSTDFKANVDRHSQLIADPKKAQMLEDEIPSLAHQLGIGELSSTQNWPFSEILRIAKEAGPKAIAVLAVNWRKQAIEMEQFANELMTENETLKAAAKPVASPAAQALKNRRPAIPA